MKNCVICGKEFTPYYGRIQDVCRPVCEIIKQGRRNQAEREKDSKDNEKTGQN